MKCQVPLLSPIIAQRPLSSVAEANCAGEASGLVAFTVAPLMALPVASFTVPIARPCACAPAANAEEQCDEGRQDTELQSHGPILSQLGRA